MESHNVMSVEKHIRKNGEGECWCGLESHPLPRRDNVAPPAATDVHFFFVSPNFLPRWYFQIKI